MAGYHAQMVEIATHISGVCHQLKMASDQPYEHSEPMCVGGPAGKYRLTSPYALMPNVQWKIDTANFGAAAGVIVVSNDINNVPPGMLVGDTGTTELTPIKGLLITGNAVSVPVDSEWYDLTDSNGVLFVSVATTAAAYVNAIFRHKR